MRQRAPGAVAAPALVIVVALCAGCTSPAHDGPQVTDRPEGFAYEPNAYAARKVLADRESSRQNGYFTLGEPASSIIITEYSGSTTRAQAEVSRAAAAAKWTYQDYGLIEDLTIDGRPAWGWLVVQRSQGKESSLEYVAVVSYDQRTYTIEFHATAAALRKASLLRRTVKSFQVVEGRSFNPLAALALLAFGSGAVILTRKLKALERRERWAR